MPQTILVKHPRLGNGDDATFGDPNVDVGAFTLAGLIVTSSATSACTVSVTVHITGGAGSCTLTASQPGDAN